MISKAQLALLDDLDWKVMSASAEHGGSLRLQHVNGTPFDATEMQVVAPLKAVDIATYAALKQAGTDQIIAFQHDLTSTYPEVLAMFKHYGVAELGQLLKVCTNDERATIQHLIGLLDG